MNKEEIHLQLRNRLRRVDAELHGNGPQTMTTEEINKELDDIMELAKTHGIKQIDDESEVEVWLRWAKLKDIYESGQHPESFKGYMPQA